MIGQCMQGISQIEDIVIGGDIYIFKNLKLLG